MTTNYEDILKKLDYELNILEIEEEDILVRAEKGIKLAKNNPWSFLHISKPEIDLPPGIDPHVDEVYSKANP